MLALLLPALRPLSTSSLLRSWGLGCAVQKGCLEHTPLVMEEGSLSQGGRTPGKAWCQATLGCSKPPCTSQRVSALWAEMDSRAPFTERQNNSFDQSEVYLLQVPEHSLSICLSIYSSIQPPFFIENLLSAGTVPHEDIKVGETFTSALFPPPFPHSGTFCKDLQQV